MLWCYTTLMICYLFLCVSQTKILHNLYIFKGWNTPYSQLATCPVFPSDLPAQWSLLTHHIHTCCYIWGWLHPMWGWKHHGWGIQETFSESTGKTIHNTVFNINLHWWFGVNVQWFFRLPITNWSIKVVLFCYFVSVQRVMYFIYVYIYL